MYKKTQNGYAILTTIVVVSILLVIGIGLSKSTYKQLILSSSAIDSQAAFYQADTASGCALYADYKNNILSETIDESTGDVILPDLKKPFICGGQVMSIESSSSSSSTVYNFEPKENSDSSYDPNGSCFRIKITKDLNSSSNTNSLPATNGAVDNNILENTSSEIKTTIQASGYNICNKTNIRTVERTIEITY